MVWITWATILNTLWTVWCLKLLPARIASRFGPNGQVAGTMSRAGFGFFFILFPVAISAFVVYIGSIEHAVPGMATAMEHMAAGLTIYFSFLSWCIVRSNRNSPARVDMPSLMVGMFVLIAVMFVSLRGLAGSSARTNHASSAPIISPN